MIRIAHLPQRFGRWFVFSALLALLTFGVAGRLDLVMLNAFVAVYAAAFLLGALIMDSDLARERFRRHQSGADPLRLALIRVLFFTFFVGALLDIGRFHWSDTVPRALQMGSLLVVAGSLGWTMWAVGVNRFFVPVIRIQPERGHRVVSAGPYAQVRHPGYAGLVLAAPASALALGSWWALVPALALSFLFIRRAAHEDRFLREQLEGYREYASRVRFRLVPHVW